MADWIGFTDEDLQNVLLDNVQQRGRSAKRSGKSSTKPATNCTIKVKDERTYEVLSGICETSNKGHAETTPAATPTDGPNLGSKLDSRSEDNKQQENASPERKPLSLEDYHQRQRMFEEQNRKRKAMLYQAIAERQKKTNLENEKLMHIQNELQKLDSLVSNDVAILRNRIEIASLEFSEAQKRYEKTEEEFVRAKMALFQKMELKEQLTQHLYTIIENNELRKANKLAELMVELQMEISLDGTEEHPTSDTILSSLCIANDNSYNRSVTLKNSECTASHSDSTVSIGTSHQTSDCKGNDVTMEKNSVQTTVSVNRNDESFVNKCNESEHSV